MDSRRHKYEDAKIAMINELANSLVHLLYDTYRGISKQLANHIKMEITNILSNIDYTDAQYDILNDLYKEFIKGKKLPTPCKEMLGGIVTGHQLTDKNVQLNGWCKIYVDSLDFVQLISNKFASRFQNTLEQREKEIQFTFFVMLANAADLPHLSQLICESGDKHTPTIQILRQKHGLFAKQTDTGRYKKYLDELHTLDMLTEKTLHS